MQGSPHVPEDSQGKSTREWFGHYKLIRQIGRGGMGEVHLAEDTRLGRRVALKLLSLETAHHRNARQRLLREARSASALNHPNIVTVYAIEEAEGIDFIAMEYIEGESLRAVTSRGPLELPRILDLGAQVADALAAAHSLGLIHRDIKPENILVTPSGQAKVLDFGLASKVADQSIETAADALTVTQLTAAGAIAGTVAYMSPEQIRGETLDSQTDIFSLGVVLYEIATGAPPFRGPNFLSVMHEIDAIDPLPPSTNRPDLPPAFDVIVCSAMAKQRDQRYASAIEMADALRALRNITVNPHLAPELLQGNRPDTRYARSADINIAYQVIGSGALDMVYVMGWVSNLDYFWAEPSYARFLNRLASTSRLILFDKRGTGLSDRVHDSELPTLEQRMDDVRAVMDAAGSDRAVLFGVSEGGPMAALFAATYPERTSALMMYGSYAKRIWDPEYPWAPTPEERQKFFDAIRHGWGGVVDIDTMAPSAAKDEDFRQWWAAYLRRSASPGAALTLARMNTQIDIRHVLPVIRVPTLIIHRSGDLDIDVGGSRYMAKRIPNAKYVEISGGDHLPWVGDQEGILGEIEQFLRTIKVVPQSERVLATVLVVGIDDEPGNISSHFLAAAKTVIERLRGRAIETTATRTFATFDGPARAIKAACEIRDSATREGIHSRIGLHTGECDLIGDKIAGVAVDIATRVAANGIAGEVLVSHTVKDLVAGSGIQFESRGVHAFEGIEGEWRLLAVQRRR